MEGKKGERGGVGGYPPFTPGERWVLAVGDFRVLRGRWKKGHTSGRAPRKTIQLERIPSKEKPSQDIRRKRAGDRGGGQTGRVGKPRDRSLNESGLSRQTSKRSLKNL